MTAFGDWLAAYAASLDDVGLERWCGTALLARGRGDLAALSPAIAVADDRVTIQVGDHAVVVTRTGLAGSTCTCPARTCRHRVVAALALRERFAGAAAPAPAARAIDNDSALTLFGAKLWKKAQAALDRGVVVELEHDAGGLTASFPGTGISCAFPAALPLPSSVCSCRAPFPCEHRAIAIAAALGAEPEPERIAPEVVAPISAFCAELVTTGLDHAHAGWVRTAVRLAVAAHVARLPRLERELEDLAEQLDSARMRRPDFELRTAAVAIAKIATRARLLASRPKTRALAGSFRRSYLDAGAVELVCVGAETFTTADNSDGARLHFFDGAQFAVATVLLERDRLDGGRRVRLDRPLWGAARWRDLVGTRLRLDQARRASDGAIAASETTRASVLDRIDPRTYDLPRIDDWRALAARLQAGEPFPLGDPPSSLVAIVTPARIANPHRDPVRDAIRADLVDRRGHTMQLVLPPRRNNERARQHLHALLADPRPTHILGTLRRSGGQPAIIPITCYREGEPIPILGAGDVLPPVPASSPPPATPEEPFEASWRWLETLVAGGLATQPDATIDDAAHLFDAIVTVAVADELEASAALAEM